MGDKGLTVEGAVRGFLIACAAEGQSPRSVEWYENVLGSWRRWLEGRLGRAALAEEVTPDLVREYLAWLGTPAVRHARRTTATAASRNTVRGHWAAISSWAGWCAREKLIGENPVERVKAPKVEVPVVDVLSQAELKQVLAKGCECRRDEAVIRFLLDSLCRVREASTMRLRELELERGRAKVMGKGAKERWVYFGRATRKALWLYLERERGEPLPGEENDLVFLTQDGRPLAEKTLTRRVRLIGKRAGVPRLHAHLLRHTGAVERLRNGQDVFTLQRLLGHSTLEMVNRYLRAMGDADAERVSKGTAPGDRWRL